MILNTWLVGAGVALATTIGGKLERHEATHPHMGTKFTIVLYAKDAESANRAFQAGFSRIAALDRAMNDYRADSELSKLSLASPCPQGVAVSRDLFLVLSHSQEVSRQSDGAFDVTIGPLTKLWRRARRQKRLPSEDRLVDARNAVGYQAMELDTDTGRVRLLREKMRLDLGGIAKGYAVDAALRAISKAGLDRALVNASGDLAASGSPPGTPGWKVGIAPLNPGAAPSRFGYLHHRAVATSGDAFQFVEIDGRRYSHIVDPSTGLGLTSRSSVSVLAPDCTTADAWASAASVMGTRRAMAVMAQRRELEVFIVAMHGQQVITCQSDGFAHWSDSP